MTDTDKATIDYKNELLRKSIHLCSLSIPVIYYFTTRELMLTVLVPLLIFSVIIDFGRHLNPTLKEITIKLFGKIMREHERDEEKKNLSGASYVLIAAVGVIFAMPKIFAITGFAVLILGDIAAALIGRRFGRHKFLAKSLEGTLAFFVVASIIVLITPKVEGLFLEYAIGIFAVAVGAIAENISYGWADDNLTIPISIGFTMWGLYALLLPDLAPILPNAPV
ncbi:MAG: membrane protein [Melioribacteraceae bacterium]|nr:MAG: membrane protein [Melioribacteraceae bacterium]